MLTPLCLPACPLHPACTEGTDLFKGHSRDLLARCLLSLGECTVPKGAVIVPQGSCPDNLYVIQWGECKVGPYAP